MYPLTEVPFRQIHLDFHTSPAIGDVAQDFHPEAFARIMKDAHVNSVTLFAKCHHGMSYYPSKVGPVHPGLQRPDLMGDMISALHAQGIRAPIYTTVTWDEHAATTHQEWLAVSREGKLVGRTPLDVTERWRWICMNTEYADYLAAQVEEILQNYEVDGWFFDICRQPTPGCVCNTCLQKMAEEGVDPEDDEQLLRYSKLIANRLQDRLTSLIRRYYPDATIFYNSRTRVEADTDLGMRDEFQYQTHIEIESLPGGRWGYNHFPLFARYLRPLMPEITGHTGRFHRTWGDFGGVRAQAALDYECFQMLALGAKCEIGDQLHPRGVLEEDTYKRIGRTYASVEAKEPWCSQATPLADIGVLITNIRSHAAESNRVSEGDEGSLRALIELHQQFQYVDRLADFSRYRVMVFPDAVVFDPALAEKVRAYLAQGSKVLLTGRSGLTPSGDAFALDEIGLDYVSPGLFDPDYVLAGPQVNANIPNVPLVQYGGSNRVRPQGGTETLAATIDPYFQRNWRHYCSHGQTPYDKPSGLPAITRNQQGNVVYLAAPIFTAYRRNAYPLMRDLLGNCLALLLEEPLVRTTLPTGGQVTVTDQPNGRRVVHLLYYVWQRRALDLDIVEDVIPLHDLQVALRVDRAPGRVYLAPEQRDLPVDVKDGYARVTVPVLLGHQLVVFEP